MTEDDLPAAEPTLSWDVGTAYEFFVSLFVIHTPENYDLRPSWAAKIRSRIPTTERTFLEETFEFIYFPLPWLLPWLYSLPQPKNAITVLYALQQIPPVRRGRVIFDLDAGNRPEAKYLLEIAERRSWNKNDLATLNPILQTYGHRSDEQSLIKFLNWWVRPEDFGNLLLSSLQAYYQAFFEQEEKRVGPVLELGMEHAKQLAGQLSIPNLMAELSQGVRFTEDLGKELIIVPTYWMTPLVSLEKINNEKKMFLWGARPSTMSAIPGELVPDGLLISLKALADPTRLKILCYLNQEELTPSELSRRLNLRAPTMTHHLKELRLAGLVNLTFHGQEKLYRARLEALDVMQGDLKGFLKNTTGDEAI
jgi:DNA-binding transcriptional ArsR family regulator